MRYLIAPGIGPGRVSPLLAIGAELVARGHEVHFYGEPAALSWAKAAGLRPHELPLGRLHEKMLRCRTTEEAIELFRLLAERTAPDLLRLLSKVPVDVALTDALHLGAALAVQRAGIEWATVATSPALSSPAISRSAQARVPTRALLKRLGLPPCRQDALEQSRSPALHLLSWTAEFDLSPPPLGAHHVGPLGHEPATTGAPRWLPKAGADHDPRPWVLVSVSTVPFRGLQPLVNHYVNEAIRAVNELRVRAVLTLADAEYAVSTAPAPHVRVARFVPHHLLMPRLAALVTHGGWGTMGRALREGVPMVVVPFALDQPDNAQLAERRGFACSLPAEGLDAEALFDRLQRILDPRSPQRQAARRQAVAWSKLAPAQAAADLLSSSASWSARSRSARSRAPR